MEKTSTMTTKKSTQGRKKIEIKKIEQVNNRQVTFSKRRSGLFRKASELCILSGAEVAIIVCSPGRRVFSFGHQSVDTVIDNFVKNTSLSSSPTILLPPSPNTKYEEFSRQYAKFTRELEVETKRTVMIEEVKNVGNLEFWWNETIDAMGVDELEMRMIALEELKKKVDIKADELMMVNASTMPFTSMLGMNNQILSVPHHHVMNQTPDYLRGFDRGGHGQFW